MDVDPVIGLTLTTDGASHLLGDQHQYIVHPHPTTTPLSGGGKKTIKHLLTGTLCHSSPVIPIVDDHRCRWIDMGLDVNATASLALIESMLPTVVDEVGDHLGQGTRDPKQG